MNWNIYLDKMKNLETQLEICPYADVCAVEYGDADTCQDESTYENCVIYKKLKMEDKSWKWAIVLEWIYGQK